MYFISEHSSCSDNDEINGTLIGIHENYLYSANSFEEELKIYRRKIMETRNWELFWSFEISSKSCCACSNSVSAAYGIIDDELFVAAYGTVSDEREIRFNLSSIDLINSEITDYKPDTNNIGDLSITLCNQCCLSSITSLNPFNPSEISIIPWSPENSCRFSSIAGTTTDCVQTKISIDRKDKTCTYLQSAGLSVCGRIPEEEQSLNQSNVGVLEFGKIVYFRNGELYIGGTNGSETKLEIVEDSDLHKCLYAGFYSTLDGIKSLGFEKSKTKNHQISSLYDVFIDEEKNQAKFIKLHSLPSVLLPSDPRYIKFVMDSRLLICSYQNQTITYVFGMLTLSELSYITSSNSYSPLYKEYQKLSKKQKPYEFGDYFDSGIYKESKNLGLTQNGIRKMLGLPKSFKFYM